MITKRAFAFPSALLIFVMLGIEIAQACMGVSRTINIRSFKDHMGTGASGGIGLRRKEVVLTFDDGPVTSTTNRVLAALDRECLKATFFVVGRMARNNPKLLQKIARKGHTIGHHTDDHANLRNVSLASAHRNIDKGRRAVNAALGPYRSRSSKLFRYPYLATGRGQRKLDVEHYLASQNYQIAPVTIDSKDFHFNQSLYRISYSVRKHEKNLDGIKHRYLREQAREDPQLDRC